MVAVERTSTKTISSTPCGRTRPVPLQQFLINCLSHRKTQGVWGPPATRRPQHSALPSSETLALSCSEMCSVVCSPILWTPAKTFRRLLRLPRWEDPAWSGTRDTKPDGGLSGCSPSQNRNLKNTDFVDRIILKCLRALPISRSRPTGISWWLVY